MGWGGQEIFDTEFNIPDIRTIHLNPNPITGPFLNDPYVRAIGTTFMTNDIFTINNRINGQVQVYLNTTNNIDEIGGVVLEKETSSPFQNMDQNTLNKTLDFFIHNHMTFSNGQILSQQNQIIEEINFTYNANDERPKTIWVFLHTVNDNKWHSYNGPDFPTIAPASVLVELKNSRIVEGLTVVIIGCIPIGIVAEFWIEFAIEHFFYREEKTKDSNVFSQADEYLNYYHDDG